MIRFVPFQVDTWVSLRELENNLRNYIERYIFVETLEKTGTFHYDQADPQLRIPPFLSSKGGISNCHQLLFPCCWTIASLTSGWICIESWVLESSIGFACKKAEVRISLGVFCHSYNEGENWDHQTFQRSGSELISRFQTSVDLLAVSSLEIQAKFKDLNKISMFGARKPPLE